MDSETPQVHGGDRGSDWRGRRRFGALCAGAAAAASDGAAALTDVVRLRVRYSESDQMGITYHARYLDWFVIGRTELLRTLGLPYADLERRGVLLPVLETNVRYLGPTRYDDVVQMETTLTDIRRTRLAFRYEVWQLPPAALADGPRPEAGEQDGEGRDTPTLVAIGETKHAFVDGEHRPFDVRKRFPDVWRVLEPLAQRLRSAAGDDVVAEGS